MEAYLQEVKTELQLEKAIYDLLKIVKYNYLLLDKLINLFDNFLYEFQRLEFLDITELAFDTSIF